MIHCPSCNRDFAVASGSDIPYRCGQCGNLVLGPYCDLEWIGGGGMGNVYRARDPAMGDRSVVIKIPKTEINTERARRRFEREITASARLQHENAVRAYQRGQEAGRPYLVMEYVTGRKLSDLVRQEHPLSPHRVATILLGVARGLDHAGQQGIVNRDVKPENIFLAMPEETPKLLDYGLALISRTEEQVTRYGSILGTPNYTAPEQVRDPHTVTIAADVYSLGCTAYYCLTGGPPFPGSDLDETFRWHAEMPRPSVRDVRPDVDPELDRLIQKMMDPNPQTRLSPSAVIESLERLVPRLSDRSPRRSEEATSLVDVSCPRCGTCYHLGANMAGREIRCPDPGCNGWFTVPEPQGDRGALGETVESPEEHLPVFDAEIADEAGEPPAPGAAAEADEVFEPEVAEIVDLADPPDDPEPDVFGQRLASETLIPDEGEMATPEIARASVAEPDEEDDGPFPLEMARASVAEPDQPPVGPDSADVGTLTARPVDEQTAAGAAEAAPPDVEEDLPETVAARAPVAEPPAVVPAEEDDVPMLPMGAVRSGPEIEDDVPVLPTAAVTSAPALVPGSAGVPPEEPPGEAAAGIAAAEEEETPPRARRKRGKRDGDVDARGPSRRETRPRGVKIIMGVLLLGLCGASVYLLAAYWDKIFPEPSVAEVWQEIMDDVAAHKWDRAIRELNDFKEEYGTEAYAEDEEVQGYLAQIPFFLDFCAVGPDIYGTLGDPALGLAGMQKLFKDHRDNPAYKDYSIDIYLALSELAHKFLGRSEKTASAEEADGARLAVDGARQAYDLLDEVAGSVDKPEKEEEMSGLAAGIEAADGRVKLAGARLQIESQLTGAIDPSFDGDPDEVYANVERIFSRYPQLRDDASLIQKQQDAYAAEPAVVGFQPEEAEAGQPAARRYAPADRRQGRTIVVALGGADDKNAHPEPDGMVLALARGVLHAFDRDGHLCWARRMGMDSYRLPQFIRGSQTAPPAWIAVNAEDNHLLALESATGDVVWRYRVGHDVVAPLTIVPRKAGPNEPVRPCGLLPTADGEVHALELALGKRLGRFVTHQPMTVGGTYDPRSGLAFFPAESKRVFAVNPEAIDDRQTAACPSILFTNHASGSLRSAPVVVGPYLVVAEASELEHTRLRAFEVHGRDYSTLGFPAPDADPLEQLVVRGWVWFSPQCTPDRITLVTDRGQLGIFGLNLDNTSEAIFPIIEEEEGQAAVDLHMADQSRTMAVHTEEHLLWVMAGGRLRKFSIDVLRQEVHELWQGLEEPAVTGYPVHEAQVDRDGRELFVTTMSPDGLVYRATAVDAVSGGRKWGCQLGINALGDPIPEDGSVMLIDRSGRLLRLPKLGPAALAAIERSIKPFLVQAPASVMLPDGADPAELVRLEDTPGKVILLAPMGDGSRLAVRILPAGEMSPPPWMTLALPKPLHGRPCVCGDCLVAPCSDGYLYRVPLNSGGNGAADGSFPWCGTTPHPGNRAELYRLGDDSILVVDGGNRLRRLVLQSQPPPIRWVKTGEYELDRPVRGRATIAGNRLYLADAGGTLRELDPNRLYPPLRTWSLGEDAEVTAGPFLRGQRYLLAVVGHNRLVCVDLQAPVPGGSDQTPQLTWVSEPLLGRIHGEPMMADDTLLVADNSRKVLGIRAGDGKVVWRARLGLHVGPSATPVPCGQGQMLIPMTDGTLQVLAIPEPEPEEDEPETPSPAPPSAEPSTEPSAQPPGETPAEPPAEAPGEASPATEEPPAPAPEKEAAE